MLNAVETTKSNYERLLKRIKENCEYILNLPNLKIVIDKAKSNEDDVGVPITIHKIFETNSSFHMK